MKCQNDDSITPEALALLWCLKSAETDHGRNSSVRNGSVCKDPRPKQSQGMHCQIFILAMEKWKKKFRVGAKKN